jgi:hypothetical protein
MSTPLLEKPQFRPLKKKLLREGWLPLLLLVGFWRGKHGIPEAFDVLFRVGKEDISSHEAAYSRYDIWIIHSGMWSIISLIILGFILYGWIKEVRKEASTVRATTQKPKSDPGAVGNG